MAATTGAVAMVPVCLGLISTHFSLPEGAQIIVHRYVNDEDKEKKKERANGTLWGQTCSPFPYTEWKRKAKKLFQNKAR